MAIYNILQLDATRQTAVALVETAHGICGAMNRTMDLHAETGLQYVETFHSVDDFNSHESIAARHWAQSRAHECEGQRRFAYL